MAKGLFNISAVFLLVFIFSAGLSAQKDGTHADAETQKKAEAEKNVPGIINRMKVKLGNHLIHDNLPRKFDFDKMNVNVIGFSAEFFNLRISENPDFGSTDFFTSEYVDCSIEFIPFLFGRLYIEDIKVKNPVFNVIRDSQGSLSLVDLLKPVEKKKALVEWMQISEMKFKDGRMRFVDNSHKNGPVSLEMDLIEL